MAAKGVWIAVASSVITLGIGAAVMHGVDEWREEARESRYESSLRASIASSGVASTSSSSATTSGTSSSSVSGLPTQEDVTNRLSGDLEKFIAGNKDGVIKTGSREDIRDAFEDQYVDVYENEVDVHLTDQQEDQLDDMVDIALMSLDFDNKIADAQQ